MVDGVGHIVCSCDNLIANAADLVEVGGKQRHDVTNPEGLRFSIVCVSKAHGARPIGVPSGHWTWFEGYLWRRAWCRVCDQHVGWHFQRRGHAFFAIDRARASVAETDSAPTASEGR